MSDEKKMTKKTAQKSHTKVSVETKSEQHIRDGSDPRIEELESRISELTQDAQRVQAEFINYKRREAEARAELADFATQRVVTELLPLLDNIERALSHRPADLADNPWAVGVEQVGAKAAEALKVLGVERIHSLGQPFDHNLHEAISMEDGDGAQEMVIEEVQPGYKMGSKVIRHAMVKVGKQ